MKRQWIVAITALVMVAACGGGEEPADGDNSNNNASANNTAANNTSANNTAANNTSANNTSANNTSANNTSANNTSANNTAANNTSANNTSANNTAANNTSANNTAANNTSANNSTAPPGPSFYKDVSPILQANCKQCHTQGGIAPFTLETYAEVKGLGQVIVDSTQTRRMPPWPPADGCADYKHERHLDDASIQLIKDWVDAGMPEGDPADEPVIPDDPAMSLGTPDKVLDIGVDYLPKPPEGNFDDYRCFVIDPGLEQEEYLNAFETIPGNKSIVHHMLMYAVGSDEHAKLDQLSAAEPDAPGYTCFGGPRAGDPPRLLGGWVPGAVPLKFDDGFGIPIRPDDKIVIQVHYNTINDATGTDRTKVNLHFADTKQTKLAMLPIADGDLSIQPGDANAVEGTAFELPDNPLVRALKVYGVVPHMHELGKKISVKLERDSGDVCLMDIPSWDFNWQGFYLFDSPIQVEPGDTVRLDCVFDNSMARNQQLNREPQLVTWGEGTRDEMCLNYVIVNDPGFF